MKKTLEDKYMKTLLAITLAPLISLILLVGSLASAHCCESNYHPRIKYIKKTKVVEKIVPVVVTKEVVKEVAREVPVKVVQTTYKKVYKKNRLSVLGGTGPTRLNIGKDEVRLERGGVFGVEYQRSLNDTLSVGIQVQSNQTVLGAVGIDF